MTANQSATAKAGVSANNGAPEADAYTFRAPRFGDLVVCPYCDADQSDCDFCTDGSILADDVMVEMDLHRLDCAVDALRGADLTPHRDTIRRITENLKDMAETIQ